MCVLGGGEISGSRCDVASSWCLACLCFLQLMVYREFFMDTMQMVVAIPLCFGSFVHHLWLALLCKDIDHPREQVDSHEKSPIAGCPVVTFNCQMASHICDVL